jgi:hypothetical protein
VQDTLAKTINIKENAEHEQCFSHFSARVPVTGPMHRTNNNEIPAVYFALDFATRKKVSAVPEVFSFFLIVLYKKDILSKYPCTMYNCTYKMRTILFWYSFLLKDVINMI